MRIQSRVRTALVAPVGMWLLLAVATSCTSAGVDTTDALTDAPPLRVYAAASLQDALLEIGERYQLSTGIQLQHNFAGSNTLALQIEAALSADVFISADEAWVDHVIEAGAADGMMNRAVLSNTLVVVGRYDGIPPFDNLLGLSALGIAHIAHADPDAVPAGRYARAALNSVVPEKYYPLWHTSRKKRVPTNDVRAALALAEADRQTVAIVYASDALISDSVRVLHSIDPSSHPPIRYWAVPILSKDGPGPTDARGLDYLDHLLGQEAQAIFSTFGFVPLEDS